MKNIQAWDISEVLEGHIMAYTKKEAVERLKRVIDAAHKEQVHLELAKNTVLGY